jgi:hypothetical protein
MKKISTVLQAGAALAAFCAFAAPASATDLYFQMNPNLGTDGARQAFIFGSAGSTGTVSNGAGFNSAFTLNSQGFATVDVGRTYELANQTVQNYGFKISSASAISGYFLSRATATTDMSYLIDGSKLGTSYVTASYASASTGSEQISVQAITNGTTVTITPAGGTAPVNVTLNAGQTYMYSRTASLTGSTVTSSAPVAVFSGNSCSNIPSGNNYCDHIDEQMVSVDQLSTSYLLGKTPRTGTGGDVYRVVASENGTTVTANGALVATLDKGQFYEGRITSGVDIETSKPVLVAQYLIGQTQANANTDPAMTIVPGQDQWLNSYVFATPSGTANFPTDIISLIVKTSTLSSLMVAGNAANTTGFLALGSTGYSYGNIDVSNTSGPFSITAADPFQLLVSGYDNYDSYFTYGGARFAPGASPEPAVPEPASWAMMILGMGAVGYALRKAKRRSDATFDAKIKRIATGAA